MAKQRSMYICSECGYESGKWYGKCPGCGEWNTMNEETPAVKSTGTKRSSGGYVSRPLKRLSEITEGVGGVFPPAFMSLTGCWAAVS